MWQITVLDAISIVIGTLRLKEPDFPRMVSVAGYLAGELEAQTQGETNRAGLLSQAQGAKLAIDCRKLRDLEQALSENDTPRAVVHAETILKFVKPLADGKAAGQ